MGLRLCRGKDLRGVEDAAPYGVVRDSPGIVARRADEGIGLYGKETGETIVSPVLVIL